MYLRLAKVVFVARLLAALNTKERQVKLPVSGRAISGGFFWGLGSNGGERKCDSGA
jgi:hypothetical protein